MNKALLLILILDALYGCNSAKHQPTELKANELTVQLARLDDRGSGQLAYQVRLIPSETLKGELVKAGNNGLLYHMDSCFYLLNNGQKTYAINVQSVANGLTNTYEYMVLFDDGITPGKNWRFIYQDKYINHKKYTLKIED